MDLEAYGPTLIAIAALLFLGWYFIGAAVNHRRGAAAARWLHRGLDVYRDPEPNRTKSSIKWLSTNSFNILVEGARPPISSLAATVLLQSRDMIAVWLADRLTGRRDLLLLRYDLQNPPIWGAELFRERSILAGDSRRQAAEEGWTIEPSGFPKLLVAHAGGRSADLCQELLDALGPLRQQTVRVAIRRRTPHLTVAIDLPDVDRDDPRDTMRLGERLASLTLKYCTR